MRRFPADRFRRIAFGVLACLIATSFAAADVARATPALVMDVASGDVLYAEQATQPWYPASLTKLMTVYVALSAVRARRIALDTPLVVSARAAAMPPSHMGFAPGTQVTLDNALKMLLVRSANDLAITIAEGVSGSVEAFADDMNQSAASLGLHESHFVNPNGLPNPDHYSSARDMAIIARALYHDFPEDAGLFDLASLSLGTEIIPNHNNMLGRYPGADGMKTGFTCAAGFNLVVSAFKGGRRLVAVVLGAPSVAARTAKAAALLDRGFAGIDRPIGSLVSLPTTGGSPPDMHNAVCRNRSHLIAEFNAQVQQLDAPLLAATAPGAFGATLFDAGAQNRPAAMAPIINSIHPAASEPVPVRIGADPGYTGLVAQARPPHSAIGTEPDPVAAIAYAPQLPEAALSNTSPLHADAAALPLRGRARTSRAGRRGHGHKVVEAPVTRVIAEDTKAKPEPAHAETKKSVHHKAASHAAKAKAAQATPPKKPATAKAAPARKTAQTKKATATE